MFSYNQIDWILLCILLSQITNWVLFETYTFLTKIQVLVQHLVTYD